MNDTYLTWLSLLTWDEGETQNWSGGRAMALIFFNLATKLQKSQTLQFFPFILRSPLILHSFLSSSSSSSSSSFPSPSSIHGFSSATSPPPPLLSSPSHTNLLPNHHSSSLKPSLTQNPHKEITFAVERDETFNSTDFPTIDSSFLQILTRTKQFSEEEEEDSLGFLDKSGVRPTEGLVCSAIWAVRNEWELAFLVFKWGDKWSCCDSKAWDLMIWVLGKHQKFSIAWGLIRSMIQSSMDARPPMLIMIQSYAAANSPEKAIRTFQAMEKFRITRDTKAFYYLLSALCKHGDVELAEEFMLLNKNFFPLKTESFNIILNGWCNISLDVIEAKRIWREMSNRCITPDATTYTCMISCFSKVGNLFDSLRLYDEMKKRGWVPGLIVYNSLVYVLTRENCLADALKILDKIKEAGLQPDSTTYNSIIVPLCEAQKLEEAHMILANMAREGREPNILTYHAFIEGESFEETLDLLKQMRKSGCGPNGHTFLLILLKFLKLKQPENTLKMWAEMENYEVVPDSAHYRSLVGGLAECGWLVKAKEFNDEMKSKGFIDDPKIEKLLKELIGNNVGKGKQKKNIQVSRRKR